MEEEEARGSEGMSLDGPRLPAEGGPPKKLIILCHGYGADGQDLMGLAPYWQKLMPDAAFAAPNAPMRCDQNPMGYQWFPITGGDRAALAKGVALAAGALQSFILKEARRLHIEEESVALVGFSQGTMMSLHVGLRLPKKPAAIVGFSGALADPESLKEEEIQKPPVLLIHGDSDPMIAPQATEKAAQALGALNLLVRWHISPRTGHAIAPDGLELAGLFLKESFLKTA